MSIFKTRFLLVFYCFLFLKLGLASDRCFESLKNVLNNNNFQVGRDFFYEYGYKERFSSIEKKLRPEERIKNCENCIVMDIGAGDGVALKQIIEHFGEGHFEKVFGLSVKKPHGLSNKNIPFEYLEGYLEDFNISQTKKLGIHEDVDVIFDVISAFQYSEDISQVLKGYSELLKEDGLVYLNFTYNHTRTVSSKIEAGKVLTLLDEQGNEITILDYLTSVEGLEVIGFGKYDGTVVEQTQSIVLKRNSKPFKAPKLKLVKLWENNIPPVRVFQMSDE